MAVLTRPTTIPLPEAAAFPPELVALPNWTAYDLEGREPGQFTKMPYDPHRPGQRAKSNDPATWGTFAEARAFAASRGMGVMLMLAPPLFGFDLDDCYDGDELTPLAVSVRGEFDTYTERSVSGRGVKGIGYGKKPGTRCRRKGLKLEIYDHARPFALTGQRLPDAPLAINDCQEGLDFIHGAAFGEERVAPTVAWDPAAVTADDDRAVIDWLHSYRNGAKFARYFTGQDDGDPSGGDQGMANMIAWRVGPDAARIEAIFNASARAGRDKWQRRPDYRVGTIRKAIERCNGHFYEARPAPRPSAPPPVDELRDPSAPLDPALAELLALPHDVLARRALRAEQVAARAQKTLTSVIRIRSNPHIKAERDTLTACILDIKAEQANGRADAEGWVRQPACRIAQTGGKGEQTTRTHRQRGHGWGLIELKLVQEVDQATGQRRTVTFARTPGAPEESLDALVTIIPERGERKDWGGKREPCPRCGSTATRTVTYCAGCDLILRETNQAAEESAPTFVADEAGNIPPTPVVVPAPVADDRAAYLAERDADADEGDDWNPSECNARMCRRRIDPALRKRFCWEHEHLGLTPDPPPVRPPVNPFSPLDDDLVRAEAARHALPQIEERLARYRARRAGGEDTDRLRALLTDWGAIRAARVAHEAARTAPVGAD